MRKLVFVSFLSSMLMLSSVSSAQEEEEEKQDPIRHPSFTEEIVVRGELVAETATVTTVTAEQIRATGARNVAEALNHVPGANIRVGGSGAAYIRLRGFRQRETALLIDGIPVYSPYDGQLDLLSLPVDAIERIEVVKGASSLMYGSNAMGGVINVITKKSTGAKAFNMRGEYGSGKTGSAGVAYQGAFGKTRYFLSGSYLDQDRYPLSNDYEEKPNQEPGDRANSDRKIWNGKFSLGWDVGETNRAALNFSHIGQERGVPHHDSDKKAKFLRHNDWQQGMLDMVYDHALTNGSLKTKIYYNYLNNVLDSYDDMTYSTQVGKDSYQQTMKNYALGGDVFYRNQLRSGLLLKSAVRYRYDHNRTQEDLGADFQNSSFNTLALPVEFEWKSGELVSITAGMSLDTLFMPSGPELSSDTTTTFNPQVALLLEATDELKFKASASRKTRFPTMREFFSPISGNPDLEPMKSNIFETGIIYSPRTGFDLSLTGFYNDVDGLISRRNRTQPYQNIAQAVFKGVETSAEIEVGANLDLNVGYTFMDSEDKSSNLQDSIEHRPRHKLDAGIVLRLPAQFGLSVNTSFVSSQIYYKGSEERTLDPYSLFNFKLSKTMTEVLELYIATHNLFDVSYYESDGYPREGRMIHGGIQIDF